jgi:hypothetical protein
MKDQDQIFNDPIIQADETELYSLVARTPEGRSHVLTRVPPGHGPALFGHVAAVVVRGAIQQFHDGPTIVKGAPDRLATKGEILDSILARFHAEIAKLRTEIEAEA